MADERDLPQVPQGVDSQLRRVLEAWRGEIQRLMGFRGSDDDKAVRWRDLGGYGFRERLGSVVIGGTSLPGGTGTGGDTSTDPDYTPPPVPAGVTLTSTFSHILVSFDMPTYTQGHGHQRTNVYAVRVAASSADQPTKAAAVVWSRIYAGSIIAIPSEIGMRWHIWLTHESVDGVESQPSGGVNGHQVTTGKIGNADLGPLIIEAQNLADGAVSGRSIADQALSIAKFSAGIEPVSIVLGPTLPTVRSTQAIYFAGKLYSWDGAAYTNTVPAANITGQLTDDQLQQISAAKIAGQITGTQITDNAISTPKIAAGAVQAQNLAAEAVVAGKIAAGAVTAATIEAGAVVAGKIAAGAVRAQNIEAGAIVAGKIAAGAVGADELSANAVTVKHLAVTDFTNLCSNGIGLSLDGWEGVSAVSPTGVGWNAVFWGPLGSGSDTALVFTQRLALFGPKFPVKAGDSFVCSMLSVPLGGGASAVSVVVGIAVYDSSGNASGWHQGAVRQVGTSGGAESSGVANITASGYGRILVHLDTLSDDAGVSGRQHYITDIKVTRRFGGELLVDGTVKAWHMAANSIAVGSAAIENGAIRNLMIDRASADRLQVVDADVVNLSASKILAGTLGVQRWIASIGYQPGQDGWAIFADGRAEFSAGVIRGQLTASQIDTRGLSIKDASGNIILAAGSALPAAYAAPGTLNSDVADGSNVVYNSDLSQGPFATWVDLLGNTYFGTNLSSDWRLAPEGSVGSTVGWCHQTVSTGNLNLYAEVASEPFQVEAGTRIVASAYTGAHRCRVELFMYFFNDSGYVGHSSSGLAATVNNSEKSGGRTLESYKRLVNVADVPAGAAYARVMLRKGETAPGNSDSWMFYTRAAAKRVGATATDPGPWAPSGLANPTNLSAANPITPANVGTFIQAAAISDAYIGNFIKSYNFNGAINAETGAITSIGTTGWAISKTGNMVVDAADIRGQIRADQVTTANLTSGTMRNVSGTAFINLNATGSDIVFRAGAFDPMLGRYAVQIRADGDAQFSKLISYSTWSGSELIFAGLSNGGGVLTPEKDSHEFFIDTGYSIPAGMAAEREFSCRMTSATATCNSFTSVVEGGLTNLMQVSLSAARGVASFRNGAVQNQSQNPFGAGNDRIYIRVFIKVPRVDITGWVEIRLTSLQWRLYFGM